MLKKYRGILFILASAVCFSLSGVLIKLITWSAAGINAGRSILAALVIGIYMKCTHHRFVWNKAVLGGMLCTFLMNITYVQANKLTTAANAIVLQFTEPVFIILLLWLLFRQKPGKPEVITCAFVFLGILCFFFDRISLEGTAGNLLAVFSGLMYAFVFLMKKIPGADFESSVLLAHLLGFFMGFPFLIRETDFSAGNLIMIAVLGIFQFGLAFVFLAEGLTLVSPIAASLASTIEPILNPILVACFYHETIGPVSMVGAVMVLASALIYSIWNKEKDTEIERCR